MRKKLTHEAKSLTFCLKVVDVEVGYHEVAVLLHRVFVYLFETA